MQNFDPAQLQAAIDGVHNAGMPGVFAAVRDGGQVWRGASGTADITTGRPVTSGMRHRVGSITKTFTAAAVLQQVEQGLVQLDLPIGHYLPQLAPGHRGREITVRMLLNHTSGLPDYLPYAYPSFRGFPSLADVTPTSLDDNRSKQFDPAELVDMGFTAPAVGAPGDTPGVYSNTNYLLLGKLLDQVTGTTAENYITSNVIERAGLQHTGFPHGPRINEPHSRMYEGLYGLLDPPRDYSVYNMSWVRTAADLVSTVDDLEIFFGKLLDGKIVDRSSLVQMQHTVPVISLEGQELEYGLGLHKVAIPGCGTAWGNIGTVWGAGATSLTSADGKRQLSVAVNFMRWNTLDAAGKPQHHPIDDALSILRQRAMCGTANAEADNR